MWAGAELPIKGQVAINDVACYKASWAIGKQSGFPLK